MCQQARRQISAGCCSFWLTNLGTCRGDLKLRERQQPCSLLFGCIQSLLPAALAMVGPVGNMRADIPMTVNVVQLQDDLPGCPVIGQPEVLIGLHSAVSQPKS